MIEVKTVVENRVGLHARPAAAFVQEAMKYECSITLESGGKKADGKSIFQVLALGVKQGQEVLIRADGENEEAAIENLVQLLSSPDGQTREGV